MSPLSGVLGEAWALYRRYFAHFILISFVIYLVVAVVTALLSLAAGSWGAFLGLLLSLFGMFLLQAALVKAVQDVRDGRVDLDLGQTVRAALPYVGAVAIASILASIGITIGLALIIVPGLILLTFWSMIVPSIVIGGAGAIETVAAILALRDRVAPPTINLEDPDDQVGIDIATEPRELRAHGNAPMAVLNNSFGFGGHNVALAFIAA